MRLTVYGAGAVGLVLGSRLARAGDDVTFLVRRPEVARAIETFGVRCKDPATGRGFTSRARAVARPDDLPREHRSAFALFCMRSSQTEEAARALARVAPAATAVSFQNDLDNEAVLARHFPLVIGAPLRLNCTRIAPSAVVALAGGRVALGRHPNGSAPEVEALAESLRGAGFEVGVSQNLAGDRWLKLCINLMSAPNALVVRSDHTTRAFVEVKARLLEEARDALAAAGIRPVSCSQRERALEEEIDWQRASLDRGESARPLPLYNQVWAALRQGGPLEADRYHRRILDLAAQACIPAPVNARVLEVLLRQHGSHAGPESVSAAELLDAIGARAAR